MKRSLAFALFYLCMPVLLVARTLQRFYMIDASTGFFAEGYSVPGTVITGAFLVFVVIEMLMMALSKPAHAAVPRRSRAMAVGSFAAGVGLAVSATVSVLTGDGVADFVLAPAAFVFALCMLWRGVSLLGAVPLPRALAPVGVIYCLVRLILGFAGYAGEVTVADSVFDILTLCLLLLYFTADGKLLAGVGKPKTMAALFGYGLPAVLFCISSFFPSLVNAVLGNPFVLHGGGMPDVAYVGFAVYILTAVNSVGALPDGEKEETSG